MRRASFVLLALLLTVACSSGSPKPKPTNIGGLQVFEEEPKVRHVTGHVTYDHTPPAGGQHFAQWLRCDVYDAPVPNEFAVHSEEHGAVWLTYQPGEDPAPLRALYETRKDYVLVSPIYPTASKPGYGPALGPSGLAALVRAGPPTYALGGVSPKTAADCRAAGAYGVAVMGPIMRDPSLIPAYLKELGYE